ncbi:hypothetical protein Tco_0715933 [Tanacetum coccineum]
MDIFAFIHTPDPTKVKIVERERNEDEPRLLDTTIGCTVPLLPFAPDCVESEIEASVKKIFNEGGSGNQMEQGDSTGGGQDANIQPVVEAADTAIEDVALMQLRRQEKRKYVIADVGGASYPPKKLREDHGTLSGTSVGGKSRSVIKRLLAGVVLNAEVGVAAIPTLPFVTTSVSTTSEREGRDHTDSMAKPNLHTIRAPSSAPIMTTVTTITSTVDHASVAKEKPVDPYLFCVDSSSVGITDPTTGVFSDSTGSDFLVGAIRTVIDPDTDLQKVYVPQWSVTNRSRLDDGRVYREMVDEFAPPKFFASIRGMEHDQLFTEFNVGAAHQMCLSAEAELLKVREGEIKNLKAQLSLKEAEAAKSICLRAEASNFEVEEKSLRDETNALKEHVGKERELTDLNSFINSMKSQNDNLVDRVHKLEISSSGLQEKVTVYENYLEQLKKFQYDRMKVVNDKFDKLYTDFVEMALHLEEKFYPHLLTTISGRRWLLTQGMELTIIKCLNSPEYLSALGAAIGKAIEKGMQDGLSVGITHGKEGRVLMDVVAHNPSAEVDYISALQQLQNVNFPLLAELKSNKDVSIEVVINILLLEGPLADKLGLDELQPNVDQLMVPIHHSPDKVVIGAITLSLALDVSSVRPFSATVLTEDTFDIVSATTDTTTALSTTFASTSSIAPISVDDYEVIGADDQLLGMLLPFLMLMMRS